MIWIRSQKGTSFVEVSHVKICEGLSNGKVTKYTIDYDMNDGVTFELGVYSSKEKALKVLDMIQERIETNTGFRRKVNYVAKCNQGLDHYVYSSSSFKMPLDEEVDV